MSKKTRRTNNILLPGLEEFETGMIGNFENDPTLESELMAILGGSALNENRKPKPTNKNTKAMDIDKNLLNLDIKEDENVSDIDENDPDLIAELNDIIGDSEEESVPNNVSKSPTKLPNSSENVKKLENLKQLYQAAIKDSQTTNDNAKARRYERSLKAIEDLLRKAMKGDNVDESEFPPPVYVKSNNQKNVSQDLNPVEKEKNQAPSPPKRTPPVKIEDSIVKSALPTKILSPKDNALDMLLRRQLEYKSAAVSAKSTDLALAKGLMVVVKMFDQEIAGVKAGKTFDLDNLPPPPSEFKLSDLNADDEPEEVAPVAPMVQEKVAPTSMADELKVRRDFYKESVEKAKAEGNGGKVRRLMRVVDQYDEALVAHGKKTPYAFEELPPPPGKSSLVRSAGPPKIEAAATKSEVGAPGPSKTVKYLMQRQSQFKAAALKAKNDGDLPLAKELLRQSKGFDQMIQASEAGFPVDLSKIPALPTETDFEFEVVNAEQCEIPVDMRGKDGQDMFGRLEAVLLEQVAACRRYSEGAMRAGDVLGAKRFEGLAAGCVKDLDGVRCLREARAALPKFHYEYKVLSVVQCNPDLGEDELAVEVVRAQDLGGGEAGQVDSYVVVELPWPSDAHQKFTSDTVRKTNCPTYGAVTKFAVVGKSRAWHRTVRTKQVRLEVWLRKGLLARDKLLGTGQLPLAGLEARCTVHECVDLYEGRRVVPGKLELRVRTRTAIGGPHSDHVKEKWLVIDQFNEHAGRAAALDEMQAAGATEDVGCVDVLRHEVAQFRSRLEEAGPSVSASLAASVRQKIREKEDALRRQQARASGAEPGQRMAYMQYVASLPALYAAEAKKSLAAGNRDKAQSLLTKKKIAEAELDTLRSARK